ncbi:hypothetical protein ON010_g9022 [Phytophthora cinnamomi]|nr:hypothetical protein ON010_g9022 [Phytophthora cinnamomi]
MYTSTVTFRVVRHELQTNYNPDISRHRRSISDKTPTKTYRAADDAAPELPLLGHPEMRLAPPHTLL